MGDGQQTDGLDASSHHLTLYIPSQLLTILYVAYQSQFGKSHGKLSFSFVPKSPENQCLPGVYVLGGCQRPGSQRVNNRVIFMKGTLLTFTIHWFSSVIDEPMSCSKMSLF